MPILPVLFYHNPVKWNPPKFRDRFSSLPQALRDFQPEFPILFIDTNRAEDLHIWENEDLSPETKIGLIILKNIFDPGDTLEKSLIRLVTLLARTRPDRQQRLMKSVKLYLVNKAHISAITLENTMDRLPEANRMPFKTTAEMIFEEGEEKGRMEGRAEGQVEGIELGQQQNTIATIQNLLTKGCDWAFIKEITHLDQAGYEDMRAKLHEH